MVKIRVTYIVDGKEKTSDFWLDHHNMLDTLKEYLGDVAEIIKVETLSRKPMML